MFGRDAYTLQAVIDAGVPAEIARKLLADTGIPERPRTALRGRGRAPATTAYVWGPDANVLLSEPAQGGGKWLPGGRP